MSIRITGMNSGMDTDSMVQELVKAYRTKGDTYTKSKTKTEWKQEAWTDLNKKIRNFQSKYVANMQYSTYYNKKATTVSDSTKASVVTAENAVNGTQTLEVTSLAKAGYLTGGKLAKGTTSATTLSDLGFTGGSTTITLNKGVKNEDGTYDEEPITFDVSGDTKISDFVSYVSSAGYNASFDESNGRLFISSKQSGADNNFSFDESDANAKAALDALGLTSDAGGIKVEGSNARIVLNGAEFESNNNTFSVNGLTITAKEITDGEISIATDTDYEGIYNDIKSFIKDYSDLINEMDKLYNAESAGSYEPLTDEEKEALPDSEVEKWEKKVKDALLRRDSDLGTIFNTFKNTMLDTYEVGGETYSLSSFGINTLGYFVAGDYEKNAYHIDGNPDDDKTSGNPDKLKAAIAANPEAVSGFFQKLSKSLYDQMSKLSTSTSNRSYGNFFDDKKYKSDISKWETKITKWEDYVTDVEDRYYDQFTKMEKAMATLNSQQSYLSGLFG